MGVRAHDRLGVGDAATPVTIIDRDIHPLGCEPFLHLSAVALEYAQPDPRIIVAQQCGQSGDKRTRRDRHQPERDFAGRPVAGTLGGLLEGQGIRDQCAALRQHPLADFGQRDTASGAVKQSAADLALQRRDLPAQRRLRDAERIRGADITAVRRDFDKGPEVSQLHLRICRFSNSELSVMSLQHGLRPG